MKKEAPVDFLDLENENDFKIFTHGLIPYYQDDAEGAIYAITLCHSQEVQPIPLEDVETLESLKKLKEKYHLIVIDYQNNHGDVSKQFINLFNMTSFFQDENPL